MPRIGIISKPAAHVSSALFSILQPLPYMDIQCIATIPHEQLINHF